MTTNTTGTTYPDEDIKMVTSIKMSLKSLLYGGKVNVSCSVLEN